MWGIRFCCIFAGVMTPTFFSIAATNGVPLLTVEDRRALSFAEMLDVTRAAKLGSSAVSGMDVEAAIEAPKSTLTFAQQMQAKKEALARKQAADADEAIEAPKPTLTFAQQMQAKKEALARKQAADDNAIRLREEAARNAALAGHAVKKTLKEFAAEAVDGKVDDHFVVPHAGRAIINTTTHKQIPFAHESFDPAANTHLTTAQAQGFVLAERREKELIVTNSQPTQRLLTTVKADFAREVGAAVEAALPALCGVLKIGTDVEANDNDALRDELMAADATADALVAKFLAAHGPFALNSPEAARVKHYVDLIKFFAT
jgi:hypothetical protein